MSTLVILDRDGVINEDSEAYIKSPEEWQAIPGSIEAIAQLTQAGVAVAVATNQAGLARGLFEGDALAAIHQKMEQAVEAAGGQLAGIFFCPHHPDDGCDCRKPKPGLLYEIERELNITVKGKPFVGDSLRDLEAGMAAGCEPCLVLTGNGKKTLAKLPESLRETTAVFDNLAAFAKHYLLS